MTLLRLVVNEHQARLGGYPEDNSLTFGSSSLQDQWANFISKVNLSVGRYLADTIKWEISSSNICSDWGNCDFLPSGYSFSAFKPTLVIASPSQAECDWWNNNVAGRNITVTFKRLQINFTSGAVRYVDDWLKFKVTSLPIITPTVNYIPSEECFNWYAFETINSDYDNDTWCQILSSGNTLRSVFPSFDVYDVEYANPNCDDLRSSNSTQECLITINGLNGAGVSVSQHYNLLFQPDSNHSSGQVTNLDLIEMSSITGVTCRFINGVVRGSGIITIRGVIHGAKIGGDMLGNTFVPTMEPVSEECILLQANFEPCCDTPVSWSETYSDVLGDIKTDSDNLTCLLEITSVEWSGFELLDNYCCDDSDCSESPVTFPPNSTIIGGGESGGESGGGESGGGESGGGGFDDCVCEWLESIDGRLESINTNLGGIKSSIESLDCICDWLDTINDTLSGLELSPTINNSNPITVTPCQPTVAVQPVTVASPDVTVNPPVVNVSAPTVNNPITVTPCQPTVEIQPVTVSAPAVTVNNSIEGLVCEDSNGNQEGLACILKNALNYNSKSLTEIVDKKEFGSDFFVEISPNEFLQYKKVVKNGEDDS